ncbi:MAG: hypothetical protein FIA96_04415 [Betaproteobacteria bacterium]|nr:hypothetical protein [Betaproteobacteria bacterium]
MLEKIPQWDPCYSVGNELLDRQHRDLLSICAKAADVLDENHTGDKSQFHVILNDLYATVLLHFSTEEEILRQNGYPKLAEHAHEHELCKEWLVEILVNATLGEASNEAVHTFLDCWWTQHVLETDMEYKEYLLDR